MKRKRTTVGRFENHPGCRRQPWPNRLCASAAAPSGRAILLSLLFVNSHARAWRYTNAASAPVSSRSPRPRRIDSHDNDDDDITRSGRLVTVCLHAADARRCCNADDRNSTNFDGSPHTRTDRSIVRLQRDFGDSGAAKVGRSAGATRGHEVSGVCLVTLVVTDDSGARLRTEIVQPICSQAETAGAGATPYEIAIIAGRRGQAIARHPRQPFRCPSSHVTLCRALPETDAPHCGYPRHRSATLASGEATRLGLTVETRAFPR